MDHTVLKLMPDIYTIEQRGVRAFLILGEDRAILVDTCFGGGIRQVCESITSLPITLVTTHSDFDHIMDDAQFSSHYLHPLEYERYCRRSENPIPTEFVEEGHIFSVGDYQLEVVLLPGHTPGHIALLEQKHKFLLSGDAVQQHPIFMHGDGRELASFRQSILKLEAMRQAGIFDTIHPSHGPVNVPADILQDHIALCDSLLSGSAQPAGPALPRFPDYVKTYTWGRASMYYGEADRG